MPNRLQAGPWLALAVLAASGAALWYYWPSGTPAPDAPAPDAATPVVEAPAPLPAPGTPSGPLPPVPSSEPLPVLADSDAEATAALAALLGEDPASFLVGEFVIQRLVATIDALPRREVTRQVYAARPVPGSLGVAEADGRRWLDAANARRYDRHVALFEAVDPRAAVAAYVRLYPLFDQAYRELGVLDRRFHERLLEVLDHLLAAPDLAGPIALVPVAGKPRWAFADPRLEGASIGHKAMWRLGPDHAARVKARLRVLRELLAAQRPAG